MSGTLSSQVQETSPNRQESRGTLYNPSAEKNIDLQGGLADSAHQILQPQIVSSKPDEEQGPCLPERSNQKVVDNEVKKELRPQIIKKAVRSDNIYRKSMEWLNRVDKKL